MKATIFALALASAAATSANGSVFTSLCDSGVSNCSSQTPITTQGVADSNFTVTVAPSPITTPFAAYTYYTGAYFQSGTNPIGTPTATWITTVTGAGHTPATAVGTYNYQETLVTGDVNGPITISGNWGADNCGTIAWGSTPTAVTGGTGTTLGNGVGTNCATSSSTFSALTAFSFTETVTANTTYFLDFEVGNTGNVTGLMVDQVGAVCSGAQGTSCIASTPEPSSMLLAAPGILLLGLWLRRRPAH